LNAPEVQSLLPLSAAGNDLTLQMIMMSVTKLKTKNNDLSMNTLFEMGRELIRLLKQLAI